MLECKKCANNSIFERCNAPRGRDSGAHFTACQQSHAASGSVKFFSEVEVEQAARRYGHKGTWAYIGKIGIYPYAVRPIVLPRSLEYKECDSAVDFSSKNVKLITEFRYEFRYYFQRTESWFYFTYYLELCRENTMEKFLFLFLSLNRITEKLWESNRQRPEQNVRVLILEDC